LWGVAIEQTTTELPKGRERKMLAAASVIFVPGSQPDRFAKARESGADLTVIDLEDAVPADGKDAAREAALGCLAEGDYAIRINAVPTLAGLRDLVALAQSGARPAALFVPMVEQAAEIEVVRRVLGDQVPPLVPLIETPRCLVTAAAIAAEPGVAAMMFGGGDFAGQLGVELAWEPLLHARGAFILACAQARVPAIDVPFIHLDDAEGLAEECRRARRMGFAAKAAIHPSQVKAIGIAFRPTAEELQEATEALAAFEASGGKVVRHKGRMLEAPLINQYRALLARGDQGNA
jgi:(S)-citramalyl-CoA lyase